MNLDPECKAHFHCQAVSLAQKQGTRPTHTCTNNAAAGRGALWLSRLKTHSLATHWH